MKDALLYFALSVLFLGLSFFAIQQYWAARSFELVDGEGYDTGY